MASRELPVTVALAALSATVALSFGAIFLSDAYVGPLLGAALLPHALGWVCRRWSRSRASSAVFAAVGLVVYAIALVGAPGLNLVSRLADRFQAGWDVVRAEGVPIHATEGTVLLAAIVVWVAAAVADELAFGRDGAMSALAPGAMVVIWLRALGVRHGWVPSTVGFGVAAAAFLALQHQALLERRRTRVGPTAAAASRLVGVAVAAGLAATLVGAAVAPALPGGGHPLVGIGDLAAANGDTSYRTNIAPLVNVGDQLRQSTRQELFTVRATTPDYWRITALDEYSSASGGQWTLTARGNGAVGQGLSGVAPRGTLHQSYRIGPLGERWMPAAYDPVAVSRTDTLVVRTSGTLVTDRPSVTNLAYSVDSRLPATTATPAQQARTAGPVPAALRRYTALPSDVPAIVLATARTVTAGRTLPYDRAAALRDYFRSGLFTYNASVVLGDDEDAMARFLAQRSGFCVQFAATYAVMARSLGIPARVAVGFTPGTRDASGAYHVTNDEAHAWPEVWLAGLGWTHLFDPTPRSNQPGASALPGEPPPGGTPPSRTTVPTTVPTSPTPVTGGGGGNPAPGRPVTVARAPSGHGGSLLGWVLAIAGLLALGTVGALGAVAARKARRRARRRGAADPAERVAGAWAETLDGFREAGLGWPASLTPLEVAEGLPPRVDQALEPPLSSLAGRYTEARYGSAAPPTSVADAAWREVDEVRRVLDAALGLRTRLRARFRLRDARQPEPAGWSERRSRSTKV